MKTSLFRICMILALALAVSPAMLRAQEGSGLLGVWNVAVTVRNCSTGDVIRVVNSLQMFGRDGSETETANTASRGISVGVWSNAGGQTYNANYWFYRYTTSGTFASLAKATETIVLGDNNQFTSSGVIQDFDASGNLISTGCVTHAATRLANATQQ